MSGQSWGMVKVKAEPTLWAMVWGFAMVLNVGFSVKKARFKRRVR